MLRLSLSVLDGTANDVRRYILNQILGRKGVVTRSDGKSLKIGCYIENSVYYSNISGSSVF